LAGKQGGLVYPRVVSDNDVVVPLEPDVQLAMDVASEAARIAVFDAGVLDDPAAVAKDPVLQMAKQFRTTLDEIEGRNNQNG
jgi:hypothetical protein